MPAEAEPGIELKSAVAVDQDAGAITQTVGPANGFEMKSAADGTSYVEGYIATKEAYATPGQPFDQEFMTEDALRDIANQINEANNNLSTGEVAFPNPADVETVTGNLEHQSSPAAKKMETIRDLADTRTVPAISMTEAKFDGYGVKVKTPIREHALPNDTVEAIKSNIKEGILSAYSIEFKPVKDKITRAKEGVKRMIDKVNVTGVGLTSAPKNPTTTLTGAEIKSVLADSETEIDDGLYEELKSEAFEEIKAETQTVAGVTFRGTKSGELDESEIPNDNYESHYLFPADTKTESSYPVVDADGFLRSGNLEAAKQLGARGNVSEEELMSKLKALNKVFDNPPLTFEEETRNNINGDTTVTDNEEEAQGNSEAGEETKSVADEVEELKSVISEVKETNEEVKSRNEELEEENEELKSQLEDYQEIDEMKSELKEELEDLKDEVKSAEPEEEPVADETEQRMEETKSETEQRLEAVIQAANNPRQYAEENKSVLADKFGVEEDEVTNYAN